MASLSAAVLLLAVVSTGAAIGIARIASREAQARGELRHTLYVTRMNLASQASDDANIERLRELLVPYRAGSGDEDLRGFEWYLWWDRLQLRRGFAGNSRATPGRSSPWLSRAMRRRWQPPAREVQRRSGTSPVAPPERDSPCRPWAKWPSWPTIGSTLAAQAKDESLTLWDAETAAVRVRLRSENDGGWIRFLAFSPDGRSLFAYRDGPIQIEVWDVVNARLDRVLPRGSNRAYRLAISADLSDLSGGLPGRADRAPGSRGGITDRDPRPPRSQPGPLPGILARRSDACHRLPGSNDPDLGPAPTRGVAFGRVRGAIVCREAARTPGPAGRAIYDAEGASGCSLFGLTFSPGRPDPHLG